MIAAYPLVDTHAHPMDPDLNSDLPALLERAREAGVGAIVCVGYDLATSAAAVDLAQREAMCFAAVGIHPNHVHETKEVDLKIVEQLATAPKVVAIGETGLDYFREFSDASEQRDWFGAHLDIAKRMTLPVIVHNRNADDDTLQILEAWVGSEPPDVPVGVLHCFSGDLPLMHRAARASLLISFAGPVTFKNARALPEVARAVNSSSYLIETDSPYLAPQPFRGTRNEPARVSIIAERLAALREVHIDQIAEESSRNAVRLFPAIAMSLPGLGSAL
ncbi:MAG: TatD family hydrolase [Chloroflexota bacterium]